MLRVVIFSIWIWMLFIRIIIRKIEWYDAFQVFGNLFRLVSEPLQIFNFNFNKKKCEINFYKWLETCNSSHQFDCQIYWMLYNRLDFLQKFHLLHRIPRLPPLAEKKCDYVFLLFLNSSLEFRVKQKIILTLTISHCFVWDSAHNSSQWSVKTQKNAILVTLSVSDSKKRIAIKIL